MYRIKLLLTILFVIFAAASAGFSQSGRLPSGNWRLAELNGSAAVHSGAEIAFDVRSGKFSGNAGCNRMFGMVAGGGGKIAFSNIGTTRMACLDAKAGRTETEFLDVLRRVTRYRVSGTTLVLIARGRVIAKLTSTRKPANENIAPAGLEGVKWTIDTVAGERVSGPAGAAFIRFDAEKKSAGGDTGCNAFGGTYSANGEKIAITDVISTMRACVEDDRMTVERQFLDALREANRFATADGKLTLFRGSKPLLTFRRGS